MNVLSGTAARLPEVLGKITVMLYWPEYRMASSLRCDLCIEKRSEKLSDVNLTVKLNMLFNNKRCF